MSSRQCQTNLREWRPVHAIGDEGGWETMLQQLPWPNRGVLPGGRGGIGERDW